MQLRTIALVLLALTVLPPAAAVAQSAWTADPQVQQRLTAGEVVVAAGTPADPQHPRGLVQAAVRISASPEAIWKVLTDCQQALTYVPGLLGCRRIDGAPDGSWADIEHVVHYSWMLPTVRYVFHAEYQRPNRIDFHRISGDLKEEQGTWLLTPSPDGSSTLVQYEVYIDPGFWVPQFLVHRSLRKDLPAALSGLRERVEAVDGSATR
ncbi:MAG TPA: SRPBCC family protein [Steroidobacteraceae bacterium]|nr:SRPBCC family protein [Steroidobacteraceae bacterium]